MHYPTITCYDETESRQIVSEKEKKQKKKEQKAKRQRKKTKFTQKEKS